MTTITKDQIHLVDGEISIYSKDRRNLVASTDKLHWALEGVTKLDRSVFVKPKDVDTMAQEYLRKTLQVKLLSPFAERCCLTDFKAGYNANKGEFSRDEVIKAMEAAYNYPFTCIELLQEDKFDEERDRIINSLRPLSIPESITINNNEVKVNWE